MGSLISSLKTISGYPIPQNVIESAAQFRGLDPTVEATIETLNSDSYRLAKADMQRWVSFAPNISQGGISYDTLYSDRERMRDEANMVYGELKDPLYKPVNTARYGYKGSRL